MSLMCNGAEGCQGRRLTHRACADPTLRGLSRRALEDLREYNIMHPKKEKGNKNRHPQKTPHGTTSPVAPATARGSHGAPAVSPTAKNNEVRMQSGANV